MRIIGSGGNSIQDFGISTALLTPFHEDGSINLPLLCAHAKHMLASGPQGVTLFGTTGEGASIGAAERMMTLRALRDGGIPGSAITLGLCGCATSDVCDQVTQAISCDVRRFLLLPPFYFNTVGPDGLFAWHAQVLQAAPAVTEFILYHIPQITQVPLSLDLILRLKETFPQQVTAVKDSAGQWENTHALLKSGALTVLVGDERLLHKALPLGAAGSICGMANLFPERLRALYDTHAEDKALCREVDLIVSRPVIPALKLAMASLTGLADWRHLRAPLQSLDGTDRDQIESTFAERAPAP